MPEDPKFWAAIVAFIIFVIITLGAWDYIVFLVSKDVWMFTVTIIGYLLFKREKTLDKRKDKFDKIIRGEGKKGERPDYRNKEVAPRLRLNRIAMLMMAAGIIGFFLVYGFVILGGLITGLIFLVLLLFYYKISQSNIQELLIKKLNTDITSQNNKDKKSCKESIFDNFKSLRGLTKIFSTLLTSCTEPFFIIILMISTLHIFLINTDKILPNKITLSKKKDNIENKITRSFMVGLIAAVCISIIIGTYIAIRYSSGILIHFLIATFITCGLTSALRECLLVFINNIIGKK